MLPQSHRLPSSEINNVMRRGKRVAVETFQLIGQKNEEDVSPLGRPRFAVIVSTKIDKRATRRNRMKRLISESIYHLLPRLHGACDVIVILKKDISEKGQKDVETLLGDLFRKANLL